MAQGLKGEGSKTWILIKSQEGRVTAGENSKPGSSGWSNVSELVHLGGLCVFDGRERKAKTKGFQLLMCLLHGF